jgi:hypothetical protein
LAPAFEPGVKAYRVSTSNATNTITAAADTGAKISILLNDSTMVENGTAATWQDGENTLVITVTSGAVSTAYTVTVTKTTV